MAELLERYRILIKGVWGVQIFSDAPSVSYCQCIFSIASGVMSDGVCRGLTFLHAKR